MLVSLIFIFIITVLGFALFNLGVVESRLVRTSETDTRAFEIAQTGVEPRAWNDGLARRLLDVLVGAP